MKKFLLVGMGIGVGLIASCSPPKNNTLTPQEIADGWELLFDGKTMKG